MRDIKFRAWNKQIKKMAYDVQNEYDTIAGIRYWVNGEITDQEPNCTSFGEYLDDSETWDVMQYTGLKDKNGKEIYEGDILKSNIKEGLTKDDIYPTFIVSWEEDYCRYVLKRPDGNDGWWGLEKTTPVSSSLKVADALEVIGDIYSNPELLK